MLNEAQYEQDWVAQGLAPERPHMETNRWLEAAFPTTTRRRPAPETETFELLGVKLVWTKDRGRPFPEPVLNAIKTLIEFAELPDGWNSYGGRNLNAIALRSVLELVIRGHQFAYVPRLVPMPDGGVSLIWEGGSKELELTVSADGSTEGLLSIGEDEVELMPGSPVAEGLALLERYFAAAQFPVPELPDWAIDDPAIQGAMRLLRRVPFRMVHAGVIEKSNFREDEVGRGLSVTLWETPADLNDVRRFNEDFGVVCVSAGVFRDVGATIVRVPLVGNLNHLEIFPKFSPSPLKAIKQAAKWVYYPSWVEAAHQGAVEGFQIYESTIVSTISQLSLARRFKDNGAVPPA